MVATATYERNGKGAIAYAHHECVAVQYISMELYNIHSYFA